MKILAIRGQNIASLSSGFEIDFRSEPLASAGLFAITGPTGAGKSTLLDILCLALYDKTPRLRRVEESAQIPDVTDSHVSSSDPRTLLRKGAGEGYAEVDYVGSDAVAYRTRWAVRRAYGSKAGKLQNVTMSLKTLSDGQPVGGDRKSDILKEIEKTIGLSFEQFTRAVLLAQNDFAAFLRARDDDRADLLQTLTGTNMFSNISIQSFQRMKAEEAALETLKSQLADQAPMPMEDRQIKEVELKTTGEKLAAKGEEIRRLESQQQWFTQANALQQRLDSIRQSVAAAQSAVANASDRYTQLERVDCVQSGRPLINDINRLRSEVNALHENNSALEADVLKLHSECEARIEAATRVQSRCEEAERDYKCLQPLLDEAKQLDADLNNRVAALSEAAQINAEASMKLAQEEHRKSELGKEIASHEHSVASGKAWLDAHALQQSLTCYWPRWEAYLAQSEKLLKAQSDLSRAISTTNSKIEMLKRQSEHSLLDLAAKRLSAREGEQHLAALSAALNAINIEEKSRAKSAFVLRRESLEEAVVIWHGLLAGRKTLRELGRECQEKENRLKSVKLELIGLADQQPQVDLVLLTHQRSLEAAQRIASQSVESLRSQLSADEPCPVCGSKVHPFTQIAPEAADILESLKELVNQARKDQIELGQKRVALSTESQLFTAQLENITKEMTSLQAIIHLHNERWAERSINLNCPTTDESCVEKWLSEEVTRIKTEIAGLEQAEYAYRKLSRERDTAQSAYHQAIQHIASAERALSLIDQQREQADKDLGISNAQRDAVANELETTLKELDAAFQEEGWRNQWLNDPKAFSEQAVRTVKEWQIQDKQVADSSLRLTELKGALEGINRVCEQARQRELATQGHVKKLEAEFTSVSQRRKAVLMGEAVEQVVLRHEEKVQQLRANVTAANNLLHETKTHLARAEEKRAGNTQAIANVRETLDRSEQAFESWMSALNASASVVFTRQEVESLLRISDQLIQQERGALAKLDQRLLEETAKRTECERSFEQHELARPIEANAIQVEQALTTCNQEKGAITEIHTALRLSLLQDDERRQKSTDLIAAVRKKESEARVWAQLADLIGSADGKKFRNFAQQMTLDVLLGYANRHLESLSRRYRLRRVSDTLGLLVIDLDMGGETRSVHSLSGGESFLVSLALALALASLSSHRVKVESLFIDEGFGTLDADSLQIAMEALDKLQAQGRKVGVISHVQDMTERIGTRIQVNRGSDGTAQIRVR